jgi:hypothetical protein
MKFLTHSLPELLDKIAPFLLVTNYLLLERPPGNRTILVFHSDNLVNSLIDLLSYCQELPQHRPQPECLSGDGNSKTWDTTPTSMGEYRNHRFLAC